MLTQERETRIKALLEERVSPMARSNLARLKTIDHELRLLAGDAAVPVKRAEKRSTNGRG